MIVEVLEDGIVERGILSFDRLRYYYSRLLQLSHVCRSWRTFSFISSVFPSLLCLLTAII